MPALVDPAVRFRESFLRAMAGFAAEGRGGAEDNSSIGRDLQRWGSRWQDPAVFAEYVAEVKALAHPDTPRPAGHVPSTTKWWVDGEEYLGRIQLRNPLTDFLREYGGHIGYDVAPEHRRRGHATAMLRALLPIAAERHGLEWVLITCDDDNIASRKVIEACGGVYEDQRGVKLRYWVPTA